MADYYITCSVNPCQIQVTSADPLQNIDLDGGVAIAGAIAAVWAAGFVFKLLVRALSIDSNNSTSESES